MVVGCISAPPDVPVCVEVAEYGQCFWTISKKEAVIDNTDMLLEGKKWNEVKEESLYLPPGSWVLIKQYILKMCAQTSGCKNE